MKRELLFAAILVGTVLLVLLSAELQKKEDKSHCDFSRLPVTCDFDGQKI